LADLEATQRLVEFLALTVMGEALQSGGDHRVASPGSAGGGRRSNRQPAVSPGARVGGGQRGTLSPALNRPCCRSRPERRTASCTPMAPPQQVHRL